MVVQNNVRRATPRQSVAQSDNGCSLSQTPLQNLLQCAALRLCRLMPTGASTNVLRKALQRIAHVATGALYRWHHTGPCRATRKLCRVQSRKYRRRSEPLHTPACCAAGRSSCGRAGICVTKRSRSFSAPRLCSAAVRDSVHYATATRALNSVARGCEAAVVRRVRNAAPQQEHAQALATSGL